MDADSQAWREAKRRRQWDELREVTPSDRLQMAFQLMQFAHDLAEGAERARARA